MWSNVIFSVVISSTVLSYKAAKWCCVSRLHFCEDLLNILSFMLNSAYLCLYIEVMMCSSFWRLELDFLVAFHFRTNCLPLPYIISFVVFKSHCHRWIIRSTVYLFVRTSTINFKRFQLSFSGLGILMKLSVWLQLMDTYFIWKGCQG